MPPATPCRYLTGSTQQAVDEPGDGLKSAGYSHPSASGRPLEPRLNRALPPLIWRPAMPRTRLFTPMVLGVALLTGPARAQSTPAQPLDPVEQGLDRTPPVASNFGLRMHLPAGPVVTSDPRNSQRS